MLTIYFHAESHQLRDKLKLEVSMLNQKVSSWFHVMMCSNKTASNSFKYFKKGILKILTLVFVKSSHLFYVSSKRLRMLLRVFFQNPKPLNQAKIKLST